MLSTPVYNELVSIFSTCLVDFGKVTLKSRYEHIHFHCSSLRRGALTIFDFRVLVRRAESAGPRNVGKEQSSDRIHGDHEDVPTTHLR